MTVTKSSLPKFSIHVALTIARAEGLGPECDHLQGIPPPKNGLPHKEDSSLGDILDSTRVLLDVEG